MNSKTIQLKLLESTGDEFFVLFEKYAKLVLPDTLKRTLCLCCYDRVASLSQFDERSVTEIEEFIRCTFNKDMVGKNASIENYLGIFSNNQEKFILMSGEKKLLKRVSEICLQLEEDRDPIKSGNPNHMVQIDTALALLFKALRSWIVAEFLAVEDIDLQFEVDMDTLLVKSDGSISCKIVCPVPHCPRKFVVSFKAFPSYYEKKNGHSAMAAPRWFFHNVKKHLREHCFKDATNSAHLAQRDEQTDTGSTFEGQNSGYDKQLESDHTLDNRQEDHTSDNRQEDHTINNLLEQHTFDNCEEKKDPIVTSQPNKIQRKRRVDLGAVTIGNILQHKRERPMKQFEEYSIKNEIL